MTQDTSHMPLDERGLQVARDAVKSAAAYNPMGAISTVAETAIRAYLQTAAADVSGLVAELAEHIQWNREYEFLTTVEICEKAASTLQTLSASNAALEAENEKLRDYARKATATITGLTSGGSEFFAGRIGDMYIADLKFCEKRIREREQGLYEEIRRRAALSAPKGGQDHG